MGRILLGTWALAAVLGLSACGDDTGGGGGKGGSGSAGGGDGQGGATQASTGSGGPVAGSPAEGSYLFALSAQLKNDSPILFQGDVAFGSDASAPSFTLRLTPLRTPYREGPDNESIDPFTVLPPALDLGPFAMDADGSFDAKFPEVQVTGKANSFSPNDLKATVEIKGRFSEEPASTPEHLGFVCGTLEGTVTAPISLALTPDKNFFTMTRIEGGVLPDSIVYDCAGDPAKAFP